MNVNTGLSSSLLFLRELWFETPKSKNSLRTPIQSHSDTEKYLILKESSDL